MYSLIIYLYLRT